MSVKESRASARMEWHPLELALLEQQVRKETAEANKAELDLALAQAQETDRLAKGGAQRHLFINSVITGQNTDNWLEALKHWERRDPGKPIMIDLFTPGGQVNDGLAIYDQLRRMRRNGHHVTTRGVGVVASMGSVLLQAGDDRVMDERAFLMIHEGSTVYGGEMTRGEQEDYRVFSDMMLNQILDILAERSNFSKRQIQNKWKRKDWWISAPDALKHGFIDRVE